MAVARITKRTVDGLGIGGKVWDTEVTGFGVRRQKGLARTYILKFQNKHGDQDGLTIGRHGSPWTPEAARVEAKRLLRLVDAGENPREVRDAARAAITVAFLCDRFLADVEARRKPSTADEYRALLKRTVRAEFGKLRIPEVTQSKAIAWHAKKHAQPYEANRAAVVAKRMWNLAIKWGLALENPFKGIELYREKPRDRVPSAAELEAIGKAMAEIALPETVRRAIVLLATTGARSGEVRALRWEDVSLEAGTAIARDTKNHDNRVLGLNALAVAALSPAWRTNGWVCAAIKDKRKPLSEYTLAGYWQRLREMAGSTDLRIHDLRHGLATQAAREGASALLLRDLLGHKTLAMASRYVGRIADEAAAAQRKAGMAIGWALVREGGAEVVTLEDRRHG